MARVYIRGVQLDLADDITININNNSVEVYREADQLSLAEQAIANRHQYVATMERKAKALQITAPEVLKLEGPKKRGRHAVIKGEPDWDIYRDYKSSTNSAVGPATSQRTLNHLNARLVSFGMGNFLIFAGKVVDLLRDKDHPMGLLHINQGVMTKKQREVSGAAEALCSVCLTLDHMGILKEVGRSNGERFRQFIVTKKGKVTDEFSLPSPGD